MNGVSRFAALVSLLLWSTTLAPTEAHAYLDPGTGSYLFQLLVAFFLGALFTLKLYWAKVKGLFKSLLAKKSER